MRSSVHAQRKGAKENPCLARSSYWSLLEYKWRRCNIYMRYHQLSSLGCVYGLHGFRLDHTCISTSYYRTDRVIMEEVGACQPLDSHSTALFIGMEEATCFRYLPSLWGWEINVTYSVEPADSTVDAKPWVHSSNTSEVSVTVAITTLLARKKI